MEYPLFSAISFKVTFAETLSTTFSVKSKTFWIIFYHIPKRFGYSNNMSKYITLNGRLAGRARAKRQAGVEDTPPHRAIIKTK
ncbi:MAG: hypothetical protein HXY41_17815 [Chloroflexi bacterium]|nr:hypothetical protein [Chloroflexota bacterium]